MLKNLILGGILSAGLLLVTGLLAYRHLPLVGDYFFLLHLIPFGIAYSEGVGIKVLSYYLMLWLILTLLSTVLSWVIRELVNQSRQR